MRNLLILIVLPFLLNHSFAQSLDKITLDEAIRQGLANRYELKNQQLQVQLTQQDEVKRRARWLPQVNAGADVRWNTQIQRSVIKNAPFANGQDVVLRFGTPINNVLNAQVEQKVYDATARVDQQLNRVGVASQQTSLEKLKVDIRQQITEAYYQTVYYREKIRLSNAARDRAQRYLEQARTKLQAGTLLKTDFDRFGLDLSNAELTYRNDQRDYALSVDNLRYRINVPAIQPVEPADSLNQLFQPFQAADQTLGERIEIQQEQFNQQLNLLNDQRERARLSPVVSAYGAYFAQQLSDTFNPFASGTWFPYNYIGLRVSLPIFDGRQSRLNRQTYMVQSQINQNTIERLKLDVDYETKTALKTLQQARDNLIETRRNITQAQAILDVDRVRFNAGTLLQADFRNSEFTLQTAENNYLKAVYDVLVGQLQLRKALGKL